MPNSHVTQGKPVLVPVGAPLIEEAIFAANLLTLRPIEVRGVDLYPSIVLLAGSLARSGEIDLSVIAVKREILQFVIAYCSLDL